jgi:hypothetical protein
MMGMQISCPGDALKNFDQLEWTNKSTGINLTFFHFKEDIYEEAFKRAGFTGFAFVPSD